jgi:hypothetical protein
VPTLKAPALLLDLLLGVVTGTAGQLIHACISALVFGSLSLGLPAMCENS